MTSRQNRRPLHYRIPIGKIKLQVRIGDEEHSASAWMNFLVVRSPSPYNRIIGRPGVRKLQAVPTTAHGMLKRPRRPPATKPIVGIKESKVGNKSRISEKNSIDLAPLSRACDDDRLKNHIAEHRFKREGWMLSPVRQQEKRTSSLIETRRSTMAITIQMAKDDEEKIDKAFHRQIGRNLEVYVDDLVIKSRIEDEIVRDIEETVSVKGKILAYFIVERPEEDSPDTLMEVEEELPEPWILFTDGSSCTDGSEAGLILTNPEGMEFTYALRFKFNATNNKVEYEALIVRLRLAEQIGPGKVKFLIVAIDYFTKWIEAKPVATVTGNQIKKFVWENIVCRFGLPGKIISDNGKQFQDNSFKDWCEKLCIRQHFASVKHPQINGLVEKANLSLGEGIKARLDARSKNWMKELSHVLWAHRTMIKSINGDTLFLLTYGTETVIPAEIGMPTLRTAEVDLVQNSEALEINLDLLEERREQAAIR
ncbi:reverse transcriptase domain-containing protein [Tanacetum coccineum]